MKWWHAAIGVLAAGGVALGARALLRKPSPASEKGYSPETEAAIAAVPAGSPQLPALGSKQGIADTATTLVASEDIGLAVGELQAAVLRAAAAARRGGVAEAKAEEAAWANALERQKALLAAARKEAGRPPDLEDRIKRAAATLVWLVGAGAGVPSAGAPAMGNILARERGAEAGAKPTNASAPEPSSSSPGLFETVPDDQRRGVFDDAVETTDEPGWMQ